MITYTCDKCGKNCPEHELYKVQVQLVTPLASSPLTAGAAVEWCYKCLTDMGLTWTVPESKPRITVEEVIRELVHREVGDGH